MSGHEFISPMTSYKVIDMTMQISPAPKIGFWVFRGGLHILSYAEWLLNMCMTWYGNLNNRWMSLEVMDIDNTYQIVELSMINGKFIVPISTAGLNGSILIAFIKKMI